MDRRDFIKASLVGVSALAFCRVLQASKVFAAVEKITKISKTNAEWKKELTTEQFEVLRKEATEAPHSSTLVFEKQEGMYVCVACELPLFPSKFKYDSGTGWPSFFDVIPKHIETKTDFKILLPRTEYHCARCGGHHGHIFKDGPKPTGLRYCSNGTALKFIEKNA